MMIDEAAEEWKRIVDKYSLTEKFSPSAIMMAFTAFEFGFNFGVKHTEGDKDDR